ncbi:hypothetical protein [Tellurirhabdus bombi]|uniref:hypothetical protein n=1 Tax=Tellurirhabdus bombi TaxID=2907205 RepID=UPI001F438CDF|nr:hypothetical protein [Tellurirhabdus bombi]
MKLNLKPKVVANQPLPEAAHVEVPEPIERSDITMSSANEPEVKVPVASEFRSEEESVASSLINRFYSARVLIGLAIAFISAWLLADWTSSTNAQMRPGQIAYSNEMQQLWTATYRLAFVVIAAVAIIRLTIPSLVQYMRQDSGFVLDAAEDFKKLSPQQRLWFAFAVLFSLCYLFVSLLSVKLPESLSVGP